MNVACPECTTVFRIDPDRIPAGGVAASCRACGTAFRVDETLGPTAPGETVVAPRLGEPEAAAQSGEETPPVFGPQDPETRARRLARALVSDIKVYNPDRWVAARAEGTLRTDFRDEILKSWDEYVEQVGETMAKTTPYFRDALNEILAQGEGVF